MDNEIAAWPGLGVPNGAEPATRGRRRRLAPTAPSCIPIVNAAHVVVGWTLRAPVVEKGCLRHAEAERALGGPIFCTQVALARPEEIVRAGGPANWAGSWRCLALCRIEHARGLEQPAGEALADPAGAIPEGIAPT